MFGYNGKTKKEMKQAINTYYDMAGWDRKSGKPALYKLQEPGIEWVADMLP